jgi:hypothetical protein
MPEYHSPGVYVVEVASNPRPIEGVSESTAGLIGSEVVEQLQRLVNQVETKSDAKDLGIALVELVAWISDMLVRRLDQLGNEAYLPTATLAAAALALVKDVPPSEKSVVKKIRFFEGQLLEADDLRSEINYNHSKSKNDWGIVSGLQITVQNDSASPAVEVSPGLALDPLGREIALNKPTFLPLPDAHCIAVVARPTGRVGVLFECEALVVGEAKGDDIILGYLEKSSQGWQVLSGKNC